MSKRAILIAVLIAVFQVFPAFALERAYNPWPHNGADEVSVYTDLAWDHDGDSSTLYFGTDPDRLYKLTDRSTVRNYNFDGRLSYNERYFWMVEVHYGNRTLEGQLWNFRTRDDYWDGVGVISGCNVMGHQSQSLLIFLPLLFLLANTGNR